MDELSIRALPLVLGYVLDLILGDPDNWPHPVRVFGHAIARGERRLNQGRFRFLKGLVLAVGLCGLVFLFFSGLAVWTRQLHPALYLLSSTIWVWYGLANRSLIVEGQNVFGALQQNGLEAGRRQLARIVGRDTSRLSPQQIRIAVLETMSENLSDGVIAPLFFYALAGVPGMMTYKMINTLDSMLGYRNERYELFGKTAARLDDLANLIPARLTALLMVIVTGSRRGLRFVWQYGNQHKSPNSGYPEAALAGILNCRFGGPNVYHGVTVQKPYIGRDDRPLAPTEIDRVSRINHRCTLLMILLILSLYAFRYA